MPTHPAFATAVLAIDEGRVDALRRLLADHPELATAVGSGDDPAYFRGSTLLHYVAWNPFPSHRTLGLSAEDSADMPAVMPEMVRVLTAAGADPGARNDSGADPVSLLLTGALASDAGLTGALLDALEEAGAEVECSAAAVHRALANHSPQGARALLARGVAWDVRVAAGLGELARLQAVVEDDTPSREALGRAALQAYVSARPETLNWLLARDIDLNVTGVGNGTLLHRAAANGALEFVQRLVELGADLDNRDNPFVATPLDWAVHGGKQDVARWVLSAAVDRLDLFQASAYGLTARAQALLDERPDRVHACRRIWRLPAVQPLRIAVTKGQLEVAALLVQRGASVGHVGGDGLTALDQARADEQEALVELLSSPSP